MCTALKSYIEKVIIREQMNMVLTIQPTIIKRSNKIINIYSDNSLTLGYTMVAVSDALDKDYTNTIRNVFCFGQERKERLYEELNKLGTGYKELFSIKLDTCLDILEDPTQYKNKNSLDFLIKVQKFKTSIVENLLDRDNINSEFRLYDTANNSTSLEDIIIKTNIVKEDTEYKNNENLVERLISKFKIIPSLNDLVG